MTYEEWAATVERGVTITPQMAFLAGRPAQPKMKKIKMLCYLVSKNLVWAIDEPSEVQYAKNQGWARIPSEDKEIEVPE